MNRRWDTPPSVKIIASRYRIKQQEDLTIAAGNAASTVYVLDEDAVHHEHEPVPLLGLTDSDAGLIILDTDQGNDRFRVTLLHEVLHAIFAEAGLRDVVTADEEERIIKRVSPILRQVLKDNPRVYTFVTGRRLW